jgi:hypothetical protein
MGAHFSNAVGGCVEGVTCQGASYSRGLAKILRRPSAALKKCRRCKDKGPPGVVIT